MLIDNFPPLACHKLYAHGHRLNRVSARERERDSENYVALKIWFYDTNDHSIELIGHICNARYNWIRKWLMNPLSNEINDVQWIFCFFHKTSLAPHLTNTHLSEHSTGAIMKREIGAWCLRRFILKSKKNFSRKIWSLLEVTSCFLNGFFFTINWQFLYNYSFFLFDSKSNSPSSREWLLTHFIAASYL